MNSGKLFTISCFVISFGIVTVSRNLSEGETQSHRSTLGTSTASTETTKSTETPRSKTAQPEKQSTSAGKGRTTQSTNPIENATPGQENPPELPAAEPVPMPDKKAATP